MRNDVTPRVRPLLGAAVGLLLVIVLNVLFVVFDPHITRAVPLLLLLVPVTLSSTIGGWRVSVPLALLTACVYSFHFVAPIGAIRLGFTEDTATMATFVGVAVFLSEVSRRREQRREYAENRDGATRRLPVGRAGLTDTSGWHIRPFTPRSHCQHKRETFAAYRAADALG